MNRPALFHLCLSAACALLATGLCGCVTTPESTASFYRLPQETSLRLERATRQRTRVSARLEILRLPGTRLAWIAADNSLIFYVPDEQVDEVAKRGGVRVTNVTALQKRAVRAALLVATDPECPPLPVPKPYRLAYQFRPAGIAVVTLDTPRSVRAGLTGDLIEKLAALPYVRSIEPDGLVKLDETQAGRAAKLGLRRARARSSRRQPIPFQGNNHTDHNDPPKHWNLAQIHVKAARQLVPKPAVKLAIIDTGISTGYPTVVPAVWRSWTTETTADGERPYGLNVWSDGASFFWNFNVEDTDGHGTVLAGVVAARGLDCFEGVFPADDYILPIRTYVPGTPGQTLASQVASALVHGVLKGAKVILFTAATDHDYAILRQTCDYVAGQDVLLVCAAGKGLGEKELYPPAYDLKNQLTVTWTFPDGAIGDGGNASAPWVHLAAPGLDVRTLNETAVDGCVIENGTSLSAAHAAAAAVFVRSHPAYINQDALAIRDALRSQDPNAAGGDLPLLDLAFLGPEQTLDYHGELAVAGGQVRLKVAVGTVLEARAAAAEFAEWAAAHHGEHVTLRGELSYEDPGGYHLNVSSWTP
jgi:hypothetical protein